MTALSLPSSLRVVLLQSYDMCEASTVVSAKSVTVNGQKYKVGCVFVCNVTCTEEIPTSVFVKHIIPLKHVWLICGVIYHATSFNVHCHTYEVETSGQWVAFETEREHDYQCLSIYKYVKNSCLYAHRVSTS